MLFWLRLTQQRSSPFRMKGEKQHGRSQEHQLPLHRAADGRARGGARRARRASGHAPQSGDREARRGQAFHRISNQQFVARERAGHGARGCRLRVRGHGAYAARFHGAEPVRGRHGRQSHRAQERESPAQHGAVRALSALWPGGGAVDPQAGARRRSDGCHLQWHRHARAGTARDPGHALPAKTDLEVPELPPDCAATGPRPRHGCGASQLRSTSGARMCGRSIPTAISWPS